MKKILCTAVFILPVMFSFSQQNNPFNQRGLDYNSSISLIKADLAAGRVKEFSEESLAYYSRKIPLRNQVSSGMAAEILRMIKNPGFSYAEFINNSRLSGLSKKVFTELVRPSRKMNDEEFKALIVKKVEEVKGAGVPETEKETVLSMLAIAYNFVDSPALKDGVDGKPNGPCRIFTDDGSTPGTLGQCIVAGAILGGTFGSMFCGFLCTFGGAVIGGIAAALS